MSGTYGCVFDLSTRHGRGTDDNAWNAVQELIEGKRSSITAYFVPVPLGNQRITFSLSDIPEGWREYPDQIISWMRQHWTAYMDRSSTANGVV